MLDSDGFPWGTWAGALNLFVWLVVGAYLIWGCTPRYRLLGLAVMPLAAALLVAAWAGGGTGVTTTDTAGWLLALHVGLMLAGLAGLTLSAGLAGLYLWQERRLKRRDADVCGSGCRRSSLSTDSPPAPPSSRSCVLTAGIVVGSSASRRRLRRADGSHARDLGALCDRPRPPPRAGPARPPVRGPARRGFALVASSSP